MTDAERIDLACKVLAIANEARVLAMRHGRFQDRDYLPIDDCARVAALIGRCATEPTAMRIRANWLRDYGNSIGSQYKMKLADLFDRAAALHEESAPAT